MRSLVDVNILFWNAHYRPNSPNTAQYDDASSINLIG